MDRPSRLDPSWSGPGRDGSHGVLHMGSCCALALFFSPRALCGRRRPCTSTGFDDEARGATLGGALMCASLDDGRSGGGGRGPNVRISLSAERSCIRRTRLAS